MAALLAPARPSPARPGLACAPPPHASAAPPPRRPRLHLAAGCAYLRPPPAPPSTGEKGEQPPPPTHTSTSATRRLAPPPPPCAGPSPPHWVRPLPVRAGGGPPRRPALREGQGELGPAAEKRAALTAIRPAPPRRGRLVSLPARREPRWKRCRQRGAAKESENDLGRENRKWRLRKPRLVLATRRRGGGVGGGALAMLKSARGARLLLAGGARGVFVGLREEGGRALSPSTPGGGSRGRPAGTACSRR